jgi:hypothetical protein
VILKRSYSIHGTMRPFPWSYFMLNVKPAGRISGAGFPKLPACVSDRCVGGWAQGGETRWRLLRGPKEWNDGRGEFSDSALPSCVSRDGGCQPAVSLLSFPARSF